MKIEQMMVREDFSAILINTLNKHNYSNVGNRCDFKWNKTGLEGILKVYPKINSICTPSPCPEIRHFLYDEYRIRKPLTKRFLARGYIMMALRSNGKMANYSISANGENPYGNHHLIFPGNRKIRIYNFKEGYVDAIVKDGFNKDFFHNEVVFRLSSNRNFVPKVHQIEENWYREEIIDGLPLARILDERIYKETVDAALTHIKSLANKNLKLIPPEEYVQELNTRIEKHLQFTAQKNIVNREGIADILKKLYLIGVELEGKVPISISHGDLQEGNIWFDRQSGEISIIDWETVGYRSIWYDPVVLLLSIRRPQNIVTRLGINNNANFIKSVLRNDSNQAYNYRAVKAIIIMEDICFLIEDLLSLPNDYGSLIFNNVMSRYMELFEAGI